MEETQAFVEKIKRIQQILIDIMDKEGQSDELIKNLSHAITKEKINENKNYFKTVLHVICKLTNNHHRPSDFPEKISLIFRTLKSDILNQFKNWEIFNVFKNNKRALLALFREEVLKPEKSIYDIINTDKYRHSYYIRYFFPEFKQFLSPEYLKQYDLHGSDSDFDVKRKEGENDQEICKLIRKDSIQEFTNFVEQKKLSLKTKIEPSYYETNPFLIHKKISLIEYAAFFGSLQIFNYLIENKVEMQPSLWTFAIHGNNIEMIHILEVNKVVPVDESFNQSIKESIKMHHNTVAKVFLHNHPQKAEDTFISCIQFSNYLLFPEDYIEVLNNVNIINEKPSPVLFNLIQYDHINLVDYILKTKKLNLNEKIILSF